MKWWLLVQCRRRPARAKICEDCRFLLPPEKPSLFHMEVFGTSTAPRRYCEDLDIICSAGLPPKQDIASLLERFLAIRMQVIRHSLPDVHPVHVHVYESSGFSHKYRKSKISFHLVWPDIAAMTLCRQRIRARLWDLLCGVKVIYAWTVDRVGGLIL
jgi:hypothetical protein